MNKKLFKKVLPSLVLVGSFAFYLYWHYYISPKTFNDFLGTDEANITNVFMRNGNNGSYVETTDKEKIKEIIALVNDRTYKKSYDQTPRGGYSYFYDFYSGDKEIIRITGHGYYVDVNGTYYNVSDSINLDSLKNWFNSLPVNYLE